MTTTDIEPVDTPAPWRGAVLQQREDIWRREFEPAEMTELLETSERALTATPDITAIDSDHFPMPRVADRLRQWRSELADGPGMLLIRGLPVRDIGKAHAAAAYWLVGAQLGEPKAQNGAGQRLVDIRDVGPDGIEKRSRLYKTRKELTFHTDGADIIGLLCLRAGKSGGVSRICSSVHVHNEIVRRRPDIAGLLYQLYHHHAHNEFGPEGQRTFEYPIVSRSGTMFRMLLLSWYIRAAADDFPDIATLSADQLALLDLLEQIPQEDGVALDMNFQEGDMQFLRNAVVLHARTEYEDWPHPDDKRHLLRLWLTAPDFEDGDARLRSGFTASAET
ncbi:MAG: TauD/TfdA family dioxygenase [Sphingopyxis sp.]|uniref:TauD/TfdA family dioxygenase n=1 Tax=Sphingopyxis sp. TaxID=1908224 RepID=UPI002AB807D4|nr:TauD/TfdA family dioxygenase [Sphingopyxis sp.]MDZ3832722.1 TauD/TfdA family dioxygenase [Sphingopyxis sp.]